jgi:hypothetical protein
MIGMPGANGANGANGVNGESLFISTPTELMNFVLFCCCICHKVFPERTENLVQPDLVDLRGQMECLGRRDQPEQQATEAHRLPLPAAVVAVEGVAMERVAAEAAEEAALSSQMMI